MCNTRTALKGRAFALRDPNVKKKSKGGKGLEKASVSPLRKGCNTKKNLTKNCTKIIEKSL